MKCGICGANELRPNRPIHDHADLSRHKAEAHPAEFKAAKEALETGRRRKQRDVDARNRAIQEVRAERRYVAISDRGDIREALALGDYIPTYGDSRLLTDAQTEAIRAADKAVAQARQERERVLAGVWAEGGETLTQQGAAAIHARYLSLVDERAAKLLEEAQ